jgi:pimeloyl-ACP methyl ester carboxylesterase
VVFARSADAKLYYESTGSGQPVLLISGLGMAATTWWRTIPVLAQGLRVLSFDNRGVGRSDVTRGPYSLEQMADDALAVLDAAGEESAHVYGISMGGMIAQTLALRHPERVRALVLGASTAGGPRHQLADDATLEFLKRRSSMPPEEAVWAAVPYNYGKATRERRADRIGEDVVHRLRYPITPAGYEAQLAAAWGHDTSHRLGWIAAPTLVVHGSDDRLVPVANGVRLAEGIRGARLKIVRGAGHLYATDDPRIDRQILRFLTTAATPPASRLRDTVRANRA